MPMTKTDAEIMRSMAKEYGPEKGKRIFYASATKGTLGKEIQKRHGAQNRGKKHGKE